MSEAAEIAEAHGKGIDIFSGHRPALPNGGRTYDVDGVLLPRPFKITKIGPVRLFVEDVDRAEAFYTRHLGLTKSEESVYRGARCVFLRTGAEHHSIALYPKELREVLGLSPHTTCLSFGVELANYAQLRASVDFLKAQGYTLIDLPPELYPGIDYTTFVRDPDGHCIQLYYYMEQIGWDGRVRLASERRAVARAWPEALEPLGDTYVDQVFQGPFG
jgi:catechol 2,3-dioxygenase-like lactoylglutathione lyase family enzyme